jgi:hypothetical protein
MNKPLVCILCEHFIFDCGSPDYSADTPGDNWSCYCTFQHFHMSGCGVSNEEYRSNLLKADTCKDLQTINVPIKDSWGRIKE